MKTKILRYAARRDDKIVAAYEDVTFENEHMGWYVDCLCEGPHRNLDNLGIVERVGSVSFVACFHSRNALTSDLIHAVQDEALHLQERMRKRIEHGLWIPLTYVAAFEALGWDSTPLKEHRRQLQEQRKRKS